MHSCGTLEETTMYTLIGLGNPGNEYHKTRHNAGRIALELFAEQNSIELKTKKDPAQDVGTGTAAGSRIRVSLPNTFMNKSGKVAAAYAKTPKSAKNLVVLYDDIDLPLGVVRISFGRGSGGHRGIESIQRAVKSKDFVRIRIGVSKAARGKAKKPVGEKAVVDFLMGTFPKGEYDILIESINDKVIPALTMIIEDKDHVRAMNEINGMRP